MGGVVTDLFTTTIDVILIFGLIAIVGSLLGISTSDADAAPGPGWVGKIKGLPKNPGRLLNIGLYVFTCELIIVLILVALRDRAVGTPGPASLGNFLLAFAWFLAQLALIFAYVKVVEWFLGRGDIGESTSGLTDGWPEKWDMYFGSASRVLYFAFFIVAYAGMVALVVTMWSLRGFPFAVIWGQFPTILFIGVAGTGFMLAAESVVSALRAEEATCSRFVEPILTSGIEQI